jgi:hypothetical protein
VVDYPGANSEGDLFDGRFQKRSVIKKLIGSMKYIIVSIQIQWFCERWLN